ncbi:AAA family ATPase [Colwellia sp. E2M01]|uniref:AAA family ATPase n=1 Tax=Colwellia sp. E2M01 TaxID=2841561 RepID=UPI001C0864C1|nr:AAA family ATPase [Colwellia sp. E2M01]MBU2869692.1 AAA family ATPase [Colwellia sp. E2M01]
MYRNFFSLSDLPFSISPDPKYLFMSDRHKEALSHLTYGLGEVGGFALLTGEVGTGKTTISRCLMEQLPENTQAAFILNPTLSSQELLATLCDELAIEYEKSDESLKHLTDKISEKLLANHQNDINTLLIIDEAQHLQPEVLEQLRLLTNLETNTKKLLQVILIGQPELQQLLQRRDLRQLAQRITARYHLMPLTLQELTQYIEHRLTVADCVRPLFDKGAISKIHQLSQGVPRLINLLCHSALMQAYNQNDSIVNKKIVMTAAARTLGSDLTTSKSNTKYNRALIISTVISATAFIALASFWLGQSQESETIVLSTPVVEEMKSNNAEEALNVSVNENTDTLHEVKTEEVTAATQAVKDVNTVSNAKSNTVAHNNIKVSPQLVKQEDLAPNGIYTVQQGDTLFKLSLRFNVKLNTLMQWNNIKANNSLNIGEQLYVVEPDNFTYTVSANKQPNNSPSAQANTVSTVNAKNTNRTIIQNRNAPKSGDVKYQVKAVEGVSSDLLALFQSAIDETEPESVEESEQSFSASNSSNNYTIEGSTTVSTQSPASNTNYNDSNGMVSAGDYNILPLSQMPQSLQDNLPSLKFEQHVYTSDQKGWVSESGNDYYEGDFITDNLKLDKILPQKVILTFEGQTFSMPALTSW